MTGTEGIELDPERYEVWNHHDKGFLQAADDVLSPAPGGGARPGLRRPGRAALARAQSGRYRRAVHDPRARSHRVPGAPLHRKENSMRARPWLFLLAAAALVAAGTATADPVGRYLYVSPMAGYTIFDGDIRWPGALPIADDLYVGGRLGYQYGSAWALELAGGYTPTSEDVSGGRDVSFLHATGNLVFSPWATRIGGPYLFAGGGAGRLSASGGDAGDADLDQGLLEGGGGLKLWLTDAIGLRLEARVSHWLPKESNGAPDVNYVMLTGGLTFGIGAKGRDTDGDGVPDSRDQCAATPKGATVDKKGCPSDTDGDAVLRRHRPVRGHAQGLHGGRPGLPERRRRRRRVRRRWTSAPTRPRAPRWTPRAARATPTATACSTGIDQCADSPKGCTIDAKGCTADADGDGVCDGAGPVRRTPRPASRWTRRAASSSWSSARPS